MSSMMYSVSSLVHYIKESLDNDFNLQSILLKGEVSNFTNHRSGHWYFTLKDSKAKISCVMFSSYASRSKILLKEGMKVIVSASLSMYEAGGSVQLYVTKVQVDGLGDLFLQLEAVKKKLNDEGLFALEHKKPLPQYPMSIAVITAKTGAAVQDILTTIARRWPLADVKVYPTLVQGVQAANAIIEQLQAVEKGNHDVALLARGGGAIEDLWCFNEEALARVVYSMNTVVVSGVGHESDTTLVDYVSDARAATPTAAAELITPDIEEVRLSLAANRRLLFQRMKTLLQTQRNTLEQLKENRYLKDPLSYVANEQMRLAMYVKELGIVQSQADALRVKLSHSSHQLAALCERKRFEKHLALKEMQQELQTSMEVFQKESVHRLKEKAMLLDAYSPLKILSRGYHIACHEDHIIKSVGDVEINDMLKLRMQDGYIHASVVKKEEL